MNVRRLDIPRRRRRRRRPRPAHALRLLLRRARPTAGARQARRRRVVLPDAVPRRADRRRPRHVTNLTKPGAEPHDLELTPGRPAGLSEADAVALPQGPPARRRRRGRADRREAHVDAATLTRWRTTAPRSDGHAARARTGRRAQHDEEVAGADPHIWLDPVRYAEVADGVGTALEKADPDHAAGLPGKNTAALVTRARRRSNTAFETGLANTCRPRPSSPPTPPSATSPSATA